MYYLIKSWIKEKVKKDTLLWVILKYTEIIINPKKLYQYIKIEIFKNSIFTFGDELCMASLFPKKILDKTIELFSPKSVLDLGCGIGKALDYFLSKRIDVLGIEGSKIAISKSKHPESITRYNLQKELKLGKKFDLIWSFELVEHIHPKFLDNLLKTFSNHSDKIVLSAARPGQGGCGHFNEQPETYWIKCFERYGYKFNKDKTEELRKIDDEYAQNMLVFER